MKLEPGYYKVQREDKSLFKTKKNRDNPHAIHLLKVEGTGENQKYYIDGATVDYLRPADLKEYDIISKYPQEPVIGNGYITVSFSDQSGEKFSFSVKTAWGLRDIFDKYPFLKKPFMYESRKKK